MSVFVDTSVWSLAFRRDSPPEFAEVKGLIRLIEAGETIVATGLILQELLQGFSGPKARTQILDRFADVPFIVPDREDHVRAADLRNSCRRAGLQIGTIDALLATLCMRHDLTLLTADNDFTHLASRCPLKLWKP